MRRSVTVLLTTAWLACGAAWGQPAGPPWAQAGSAAERQQPAASDTGQVTRDVSTESSSVHWTPALAAVEAWPDWLGGCLAIVGPKGVGKSHLAVALGMSFLVKPRLLMIDELSLGLAPLIVKRLVRVIEALMAKGVGIVLVEQFTEVALSVATTAVVMRAGEARYTGPADEIRTRPEILKEAYF